VLAGSVRRSGKRVRIAAQLNDARTATQLWADRYDFAFGDLFSVQDRIAEQVVGAIEPELLKTQSTLAVDDRRRDQDLTVWDLVHRGTWYFHQVTRATHLRARELFREACMAAPQLAEAHAWRGRVSAGIVAYGWSEDAASDLREGLDAAVTALRIDPKNPYAHYSLAITSVYAEEFDQAVRAAEMAVQLSPGFALGHLVLGMARLFSGDAAEAIGALERGLRLSPYDPQNFVWYNLLGLAHFFTARAEPALDVAKNALKIRPDWRPALETLVLAHLAAGRRDAARECAGRLGRCDESTGDALGPLRRANPRWDRTMTTLLRSASQTIGRRSTVR
jgi:tetratricopeptide (TPR) repeat protein